MQEINIKPKDPNWFSSVESPQKVSDPLMVNWDDTADLIVVGLGGAGIAAANEALDKSCTVIGIDKTTGGGATARSGGIFYAGGGTSFQKDAGVKDTPNNMFNYLIQEVGDVVKESTLRNFCDTSVENTEWLVKNGVKFNSAYYKKKTSYPDAGHFLYHSDNSLVPKYMENAEPAPRGHRGYEEGPFKPVGVGGTIYHPLKKSAIKKGLKIYPQTEARGLIVNSNNDVVGIKVLSLPGGKQAEKHKKLMRKGEAFQMLLPQNYPGASFFQAIGSFYINRAKKIEAKYREIKLFRAKKGVCIAAGGFIFNREMVKHYAPKYFSGMPLGTVNDDGSGIRLGQSVGGRADLMDRVTAWRMINPPTAFAQGIVVNKSGNRFTNEMVYGATLGDAMCEKQNGKSYLILDEVLFKKAKAEAKTALPFQRDPALIMMYFNARKKTQLSKLSKIYDIDESNLKKSIEKYNASARSNKPCEYGKAAKDVHELKAPFYIMDISIDSRLSHLPCITIGVLVLNEATWEVLNKYNN